MFLTLWYYLRGYVIVKVSGGSIEKFVNLILHHGIYIWDVKREDNSVFFKIQINNFKKMKGDLKKTHCRVKIIKKCGLPFKMHRYKKRKAFVIGVVIFIAILWSLSSFVWLVEVEGNERISGLDIIHSLEKKGFSEGKFKGKMNLREAEAYLLSEYPDIVWTGIRFEGTKLVVSIAESIEKPRMTDLNEPPKALVAKRDALITYIATQKGKPLVKVGDIVKKGELLVAGEMPLGEEDPTLYYTAAKAEVKGRTTYTTSGQIALTQVKKRYLNKASKKIELRLFDKSLKLYDQKEIVEPHDEYVTLHQLKITNLFPLPFAIQVKNSIAYEPEYYTISEEEAKDRLISSLWDEVKGGLSEQAKILKREAFFQKTGNAISGTLYVYVEEDIGYQIEWEKGQDLQNKGEIIQ